MASAAIPIVDRASAWHRTPEAAACAEAAVRLTAIHDGLAKHSKLTGLADPCSYIGSIVFEAVPVPGRIMSGNQFSWIARPGTSAAAACIAALDDLRRAEIARLLDEERRRCGWGPLYSEGENDPAAEYQMLLDDELDTVSAAIDNHLARDPGTRSSLWL